MEERHDYLERLRKVIREYFDSDEQLDLFLQTYRGQITYRELGRLTGKAHTTFMRRVRRLMERLRWDKRLRSLAGL